MANTQASGFISLYFELVIHKLALTLLNYNSFYWTKYIN